MANGLSGLEFRLETQTRSADLGYVGNFYFSACMIHYMISVLSETTF